jgi:hypothetical protein
MHCVQFEMRLNQLLDDRRDPECDLDLAEHARECPGCADLLIDHETLLHGVELRRFDEPSAGPDLAVRVAAEVAHGSGDSAWRRWSWSVGTVAAALLLTLALWHRFGTPADPARIDRPSVANDENWYNFQLASFDELTQEFRKRSPQWAEQVADGLKPVADSMSAALNGLRKRFSGGEPAVRSSQFEPPTLSRIGAIG